MSRDQVFAAERARLTGLAYRIVGSVPDAEDVVQDTFTEAFRDLTRLRKLDSLRPWLLQIVVHQAHRRFRRRSILRRLGLYEKTDDAMLASLVDPSAPPETHLELARVDRALQHLSSVERFAWVLRYVEGYSLEEAAAACECSLATIKRRIAKANECVERHLQDGRGRSRS